MTPAVRSSDVPKSTPELEQRGEGPGEPGRVDLAEEQAQHGDVHRDLVHRPLARRRPVEPEQEEDAADEDERDQPPAHRLDEGAEPHQGAAREGEVGAFGEVLEQLGEHRQQEDGQQGDDAGRDEQDGDRVDHARARLADEPQAGLVVPRHPPQGLGDAASRLGDPDHAEEEGVERLRLAGHRLGQRIAAADGHLDAADDRPQGGPGELRLQARQRLQRGPPPRRDTTRPGGRRASGAPSRPRRRRGPPPTKARPPRHAPAGRTGSEPRARRRRFPRVRPPCVRLVPSPGRARRRWAVRRAGTVRAADRAVSGSCSMACALRLWCRSEAWASGEHLEFPLAFDYRGPGRRLQRPGPIDRRHADGPLTRPAALALSDSGSPRTPPTGR